MRWAVLLLVLSGCADHYRADMAYEEKVKALTMSNGKELPSCEGLEKPQECIIK